MSLEEAKVDDVWLLDYGPLAKIFRICEQKGGKSSLSAKCLWQNADGYGDFNSVQDVVITLPGRRKDTFLGKFGEVDLEELFV